MILRLLPVLTSQMGLTCLPTLSQTCRNYAAAAGSMALVKDLRERSGAPISDVKSALVEAAWDLGMPMPHRLHCRQGAASNRLC